MVSPEFQNSPKYGVPRISMETITYAGSNLYFGYDADRLLMRAFNGFYITRDPANGLPTLVTGSSSLIYRLAPTYNGYGEMDGQSLSVWNKPISAWNLTRDTAGRITGKTETVNTVPAQQYNYAYAPTPPPHPAWMRRAAIGYARLARSHGGKKDNGGSGITPDPPR